MSVKAFDRLVECFNKLPGVGKKSAQKYAYHAALADSFMGLNLAHSIEDAIRSLRHCEMCGGISENEICDICADENRDNLILCVVQNAKDIITIEASASFGGRYFVFDDTNRINALAANIDKNGVREIIFAFTPGISSDGLMLFIEDHLSGDGVSFTKIAQGIPTGVSLENVDILSLSKAISERRTL